MMQVGVVLSDPVATVSIDCRACGSVPASYSVRLYIPRFVSVNIPRVLARIPRIEMTIPRILARIPGVVMVPYILARIPGISVRRCPDHRFCQRHRHRACSSFFS